MEHKAGFVNIIGNPNVGKSTLMNALVSERLSIITPKAQTTRHRIFGILNELNIKLFFQILLVSFNLRIRCRSMMKFVSDAFEDADVFLYLVEPGDRALKDHDSLKSYLN